MNSIKTETSAIHSETTGINTIVNNSSHGNANLLTVLNSRSTLTSIEIPSASTIAALVHDEIIEGTLTARQMQRINFAALTGESSGGGTTTLLFKGISTTVNRVQAGVDATGNRISIIRIGT